MRGLRFIILAVAVAAGVGAVALVRSELERARQPAPVVQRAEAPKPPERSQVLVAARELKMGELLRPADLRWQPWPKDAISEFYVTKEARPRAIEESEGVIVRAGLVAGEPIADDKLIRLKKPTVMAAFLRQGYRAISINISPATTAGGFVLPGDYVDVIMTSKVRTEEPSEAGAPESRPRRTRVLISRTLLTSVRVLGIDERFAPGNAANSGKVRTATLEVTPEQAEIVALAEQGGDLRLALRSVAELIPEHGQRPIDPVPVLAFDPREGAEDGEEVAPAHLVKTLRFNTPGSMALE